eukprot:scaffold12330_cov117-Alexandrium_tamarense.AAC.1
MQSFGMHDEPLDSLGTVDTLLTIQVGTGLINEVHISGSTQGQTDGKPLQLSTRMVLHSIIHQWIHRKRLSHH